MALTGNFLCSSFKLDLLCARHNFLATGGHSFKMALYTSAATLSAATTAYTATGEVTGPGYTAGGSVLTRVDPALSGTTAFTDFGDPTWVNATITVRGALIYNDTAAGKNACNVIDFGADKSSSAGDFTVILPVADAANAIIRIT